MFNHVEPNDFLHIEEIPGLNELRRECLTRFIHNSSLSFDSGYFLEFGVFNGVSINVFADVYPNKIIYGFDSFEGLPEEWSWDGNKVHKKGHFAVKRLPEVGQNVKLIKGWFDDTLPLWKVDHTGDISFLHIDCDLYSSTMFVLKELNSQIVPGTLILFDELINVLDIDPNINMEQSDDRILKLYTSWREYEWRALNEWLSDYDRLIEILARNDRCQALIRVLK